jgi:hypothetical protein
VTHPWIVPLATVTAIVLRQLIAEVEKRTDWTPEDKRLIPPALAIMSVGLSIASYVAGLPVDEASVMGGSAVLSVAVNEVMKARKPAKKE